MHSYLFLPETRPLTPAEMNRYYKKPSNRMAFYIFTSTEKAALY